MKLLKEYKTPQTLVISANYINSVKPLVLIDDDETYVSINLDNGMCIGLDSTGFFTILTKEEFLEYSKTSEFQDDWTDCIVINDYVGKIEVTALIRGGNGLATDDWNTQEYFSYQDLDCNLLFYLSGEYDVEPLTVTEALKAIKDNKKSKLTDKLSNEEKEDLFGEIENQGFGYWIQHYGYKGDNDDTLRELCEKGKNVLNQIEDRLRKLGVEV